MAGKASRIKTGTIGLVLASSIAAGILGLTLGKTKMNVPSYRVTRVIDGDTFETKEKQWIRLSGIDSPEEGFCGYEQARQALEQLILGKDLYIKITYHDSTRLMGLVYNDKGFVSTQMLKSGWTELNDRDNLDLEELKTAQNNAKSKKLGLFSPLCTQETNPNNKSCNIKANNTTNNNPTYHMPGCNSYNSAIVQLHHGDRWFCTEKEAQNAGFIKAQNCP